MSIAIWEPRRYVESVQSILTGTNPAPMDGIRGVDTMVKEVPIYDGTITACYADTGEMNMTLYGVSRDDIKLGYFLSQGNDEQTWTYIVEAITWERGDTGYVCRVEGRSIESVLDDEYYPIAPGTVYEGSEGTGSAAKATRAAVETVCRRFMGDFTQPFQSWVDDYPTKAGWWRDADRRVTRPSVYMDVPTDAPARGEGTGCTRDVWTYGAHLRTLCALWGWGYMFTSFWDAERKLFNMPLRVYQVGDDLNGVVLDTRMAGVTAFEVTTDRRDRCNLVMYAYTDHVDEVSGQVTPDVEHVHYGYKVRPGMINDVNDVWPGEWLNAADFAENIASSFVDLGAVPSEADGVPAATLAWVSAEASAKASDTFAVVEESAKCSYDNTGPIRYGRDFILGSTVAIVDQFTGYAATQRLNEVKTTYSAGELMQYDFTFGNRLRTTAEKINERFGTEARRTSSFKH